MSDIEQRIAQLKQTLAQQERKFRPVLSEEAIQAFETLNGIVLPLDFRLFISIIGNGGEGPPDYGLQPLVPEPLGEAIGQIFPFDDAWVWEEETEVDEELRAKINYGNLYLGTDGCGINWHLIVTGPQRGTVWQLAGEGIQPCRPAMTFSNWVEAWASARPGEADLYWYKE